MIWSVPDSQRYTNIDQLIATIESLGWKAHHLSSYTKKDIEDEIHYILIGLKNTKKEGNKI